MIVWPGAVSHDRIGTIANERYLVVVAGAEDHIVAANLNALGCARHQRLAVDLVWNCHFVSPPAWSATALPHYLAQGAANCCGHRGGSSRMSGGSGFGQDAIHAGDT
jgi:hypothetical protein